MYPFVSDMYRECILCVMYLRVKIQFILNVFRMYPECIVKKDTYISYDSQSDSDTNVSCCIFMYLDVS